MIVVTWTYPDGSDGHPSLPRHWGKTYGITPENAARFGFVRAETEIPDPPVTHTYSKLRLYDALVDAGIWADIKTAIEGSGQWDRWTLANELSTDYTPFAQLLDQLRQTFGDELTDNILSQAEI